MSYAGHNNFDRAALSNSYWYAGRANGDLPIQSFGSTHRWATACDQYGVAFCVARTPINPMTSRMYQGEHKTPIPEPQNPNTFACWWFVPTAIDGVANSVNIRAACSAAKMKIPCDYGTYTRAPCSVAF